MKKILKYLLIALGAVLLLGILFILYIVNFLPNIPAENIKISVTPERIERGRYLVNNVAGCVDCHSTRDWSKLSAPIIPGTEGKGGEVFDKKMGLPGSYMAGNITPANLKDWSDGEIYRAISSGIKKDNKAIFPIMPYLGYGKMDKEDIYDIIAYLRTLKPIENKTAESSTIFPMNIILHTIPKAPQPTVKPDTSDRINYGKYLVTAGSCVDCHTKMEKGRFVENMKFAGGMAFPLSFGTVYSANITPDKKTGIGEWTKEEFIFRFKSMDIKKGYVPTNVGPKDFNTYMPWTVYAGMKASDLAAIYDYLHSLKPIVNKVEKMKFNK